jgi:hypothetical protein
MGSQRLDLSVFYADNLTHVGDAASLGEGLSRPLMTAVDYMHCNRGFLMVSVLQGYLNFPGHQV